MYKILAMIVILTSLTGCGFLSVIKPGATRRQISVASILSREAVSAVESVQQTKANALVELSENIKYLGALDSPEKVTAFSELIIGAQRALEGSAGVNDAVKVVTAPTVERITQQADPKAYKAYAKAQGAVIARRQDNIMEGINVTSGMLKTVLGGLAGSGGLGAFIISLLGKNKTKKEFLKADGKAINDFAKTPGREEAGKELLALLAKRHSNVKGNAKKEHKIL
jgi:hypothetical protein